MTLVNNNSRLPYSERTSVRAHDMIGQVLDQWLLRFDYFFSTPLSLIIHPYPPPVLLPYLFPSPPPPHYGGRAHSRIRFPTPAPDPRLARLSCYRRGAGTSSDR